MILGNITIRALSATAVSMMIHSSAPLNARIDNQIIVTLAHMALQNLMTTVTRKHLEAADLAITGLQGAVILVVMDTLEAMALVAAVVVSLLEGGTQVVVMGTLPLMAALMLSYKSLFPLAHQHIRTASTQSANQRFRALQIWHAIFARSILLG